MPSRYTLHVALTKPLVIYVARQVTAGHYVSASAVVRAGLQLLIERDQAETPSAQRPNKRAASCKVENV